MADYYPLIANAVAALDKNTGENRRALYERARTALVAQLRGVQPALEESEITRERLALEEAIRKIEAESSRRAREEARPPLSRRADVAQRHDAQPPVTAREPSAHPTASDATTRQSVADAAAARSPGQRRSLSEEALKGFRDGVSGPRAPLTRTQRPAFPEQPRTTERGTSAPPALSEPNPLDYADLDTPGPPEELLATPLEPTAAGPGARPRSPGRSRAPRQVAYDDEPAAARAVGTRQIVLILLLCLLGVVAALAWWQRNAISDGIGNLIVWARSPSKPTPPQQTPTATQVPKIPDRINPAPAPQPGAPVAQRVVLYEEDPDDPQGKRLQGTAVWSLETIPAAPGRQAEVAVRAKIDVPERQMTVTWSLRRNTDQSLPASHTIEIMFNLPADAPSGGVQNVPGVLMKQSEQTRGVPLAGLAVKVTPGYFLIGLSSLEADMQRNLQLLKERSWFDIPVVYNNNRRAILALEKGIPGEKAFNDAFAAWQQ